jgi:5-methylcytosine-specific restriction protein B
MLRTINDRIAVLKGKDYVIGHSYFIDLDSVSGLKLVFKNKVIPLLEEYFFGEMFKIKLILGNTFVKNKFTSSDLARLKIGNEIDMTEVLGITNMDDWNFKAIYE